MHGVVPNTHAACHIIHFFETMLVEYPGGLRTAVAVRTINEDLFVLISCEFINTCFQFLDGNVDSIFDPAEFIRCCAIELLHSAHVECDKCGITKLLTDLAKRNIFELNGLFVYQWHVTMFALTGTRMNLFVAVRTAGFAQPFGRSAGYHGKREQDK